MFPGRDTTSSRSSDVVSDASQQKAAGSQELAAAAEQTSAGTKELLGSLERFQCS